MKQLVLVLACAALVVAACSDGAMPLSQSTGFVGALRAAGHDADPVVIPGANHGFDLKDGKLTPEGRISGERVLRWLNLYFPDVRES